MAKPIYSDGDLVTRLIRYCHQGEEQAGQVFQRFVVEGERTIELPDGRLRLTEAQYRELVERFSAEVGTRLWESKRAKT